MIGLMMVVLMVFITCDELFLVLWGVGPIMRNGYEMWGQNYVALFQKNEMLAGLHFRNLILGLEYLFYLSLQWKSSPCCFPVCVNQQN